MPLSIGFLFLILIAIIVVISLFLYFIPVQLWVTAYFSGVHVKIFRDLVGMRLRKVPPPLIVRSKIMASKAGINVDTNKMEAHYLAGGNVHAVIQALISADKANIPLTFEQAAAIDLAGRKVLEAVQMSVLPKVIDCPAPNSGKLTLDGVAKDGIQLKAKARVTVRADLKRLVGGATEETIIARVGEGIVAAIGAADTYKQVLEHPDLISKSVLRKSLDSQTAFEIVSIDIADIDVGENVGAKLQTNQAEADKKVAQAKAEIRRAMAVALEQEMKAKTQEMQAKVVEAEAEVPKAIAEAFRSGNLGVMDFYRLRNIQADTGMRQSIAHEEGDMKNHPHE
jgi:uncharacterized protein YqfA (UPF0365 family)